MLASELSFQNKNDSRRRPALFFSLLFFAAILVLSLIQNSQILPVLLLYLCILMEAISLSAFAMSSGRDHQDREAKLPEDRPESRGTDVVSNMHTYISFAAKGSEHSRREIAFVIKNLLEDGRYRKKMNLEDDAAFQSDLQRAVFRYTDYYEKEKPVKKESREERETYVSSLERIVQKLHRE
ncbi:MAG TPA: hypothetical protein VED17_09570 [Nitrososphaerales archaeon]|nr:hypothetical protein [Nitrososphaerales archaeon]